MKPYRVDVFHGAKDSVVMRCGAFEAGGIAQLARALVEIGLPDAPMHGGRPGRHDWTAASLHGQAALAVTAQEREQRSPDPLHPALRAAVTALQAARERRRQA